MTSTCTAAAFAGGSAARAARFKLGPGARFYWQHDAEFQPGGLISVFDNGSDPPEEKQSRGLLLDARHGQPHASRSCKQFTNPTHDAAGRQPGQRCCACADGNWLMGYGGLPNFTEFDAAGRVLLDAHARQRTSRTSRTYLAPWSGQPDDAALAVAAQAGGAGA